MLARTLPRTSGIDRIFTRCGKKCIMPRYILDHFLTLGQKRLNIFLQVFHLVISTKNKKNRRHHGTSVRSRRSNRKLAFHRHGCQADLFNSMCLTLFIQTIMKHSIQYTSSPCSTYFVYYSYHIGIQNVSTLYSS